MNNVIDFTTKMLGLQGIEVIRLFIPMKIVVYL